MLPRNRKSWSGSVIFRGILCQSILQLSILWSPIKKAMILRVFRLITVQSQRFWLFLTKCCNSSYSSTSCSVGTSPKVASRSGCFSPCCLSQAETVARLRQNAFNTPYWVFQNRLSESLLCALHYSGGLHPKCRICHSHYSNTFAYRFSYYGRCSLSQYYHAMRTCLGNLNHMLFKPFFLSYQFLKSAST